jgi:hypothetical protein
MNSVVAKGLAILLALGVVGYFVLNAQHRANPTAPVGKTVIKTQTQEPEGRDASPVVKEKKPSPQAKPVARRVPSTTSKKKDALLKPRLDTPIEVPRAFMHSSKSGILKPLPLKRTPIPGLELPQKDAGAE